MPELSDPRVITLTHPGDIDGEPDEVREAAVEQLYEAVVTLGELAELTAVQVRNAELSRLMREDRDAPPDALAERWEDGPAAARCARIEGAIGTVRQLVRSL